MITIFIIILVYNFNVSKNINESKLEQTTSKKELLKIEDFIGDSVPGNEVIQLLNLICENNSQTTTNTIKINPNFTSKDKEHKITGQNNYEPEYIKDNIIPEVDCNENYIIKLDSYGRIIISDESNLSNNEIQNYNNIIEKYLGNKVVGTDVKALITYINEHNKNQLKNNQENYLRLLIHLDKNHTKNNKSYYLLTGLNSIQYIDAIRDDENYYVKVHEYNPNGTIYKIVISDDVNKFRYE